MKAEYRPPRRWCPDCQEYRRITVGAQTVPTYHDEHTSIVRCNACDTQLGHLTWWPNV